MLNTATLGGVALDRRIDKIAVSTGSFPQGHRDMPSTQCRPGVVICHHRRAFPGATTLVHHSQGTIEGGSSAKSSLCTFRNRPGYESVGLVAENLRIHCPPALPVIVRAGKTDSDLDGYCIRRDNRFVITIDYTLACDSVVNTLIHEWAHSLAWNYSLEKAAADLTFGYIEQADFEDLAHGPEFGVAFATVWRVFVRNILPVLRSQ
jgi:hypothetical protein